MDFFWLIVIAQAISFGGFCAFTAGQKNRSKIDWFMLGCLFSFVALITIIAIPPISTPPPSNAALKTCPFCAEKIQPAASKCRYCNSDLSPDAGISPTLDATRDLVNRYDHEGRTPLMNAVLIGDVNKIKSLLSQGASVSIKDGKFGTTTAVDMANLALRQVELSSDRAARQDIVDALSAVVAERR